MRKSRRPGRAHPSGVRVTVAISTCIPQGVSVCIVSRKRQSSPSNSPTLDSFLRCLSYLYTHAGEERSCTAVCREQCRRPRNAAHVRYDVIFRRGLFFQVHNTLLSRRSLRASLFGHFDDDGHSADKELRSLCCCSRLISLAV